MRSTSEKAAAVSALRNEVKEMQLRAGTKKDFETKRSSVFAAPGLPLAHFLTAEFGFSGDEFSPSWQGHGGENGNITSILFGIRVRVATAVGRRY
jgi:hypothetical protein